jgi:hypothetical protein
VASGQEPLGKGDRCCVGVAVYLCGSEANAGCPGRLRAPAAPNDPNSQQAAETVLHPWRTVPSPMFTQQCKWQRQQVQRSRRQGGQDHTATDAETQEPSCPQATRSIFGF